MSSNWQHQLEKIADRAKSILETGLWADCKFIVGIGDHRKEFKAHKLILSMSSAVFDKMLNGPLQEDPNRIEVVDIQPEAFEALLLYIYTDEIQIQTFDQACELCYVANKYMMPILVQHCISYIWKDVNYTNACRAYEFAKLFDQHGITEDCKKIIFSQTSDIIEHQSFTEIEKDTLIMILDQDELNIMSEIQLFEAVEKWIEAEFERKGISCEEERRKIYHEIICKIRFLSMSPQEFAEGPAISPYVSKDDAYAVLINLVSAYPPVKLPKNFTEKKRILGTSKRTENSERQEFCWELKIPAEVHLSSNTEFTFSFCCNREINLHGIKVIGNLTNQNERISQQQSLPFTIPRSEERLSGYVENQNFTLTEHAIENHPEGYRENINLLLSKPLKMTPGKFYKVMVKTLDSGWYNAGCFDYDYLNFKTLKFDFQKSETEELSCICGIIFTI